MSLRKVVETILGRAGRGLLGSGLAGGRALILAYHNVVPDGGPPVGDRSLHLPVGSFARQLDFLATCCEVVPLDELPRASGGRRLAVAITFDDAYRGALTLGAAELARRGLPATMFVPPGLLGNRSFWWDDLADPETGLPPLRRDRALTELEGRDDRVRAAAQAAPRPLPPELCSVTLDELAEATTKGFKLGSHTWSHPNLAALSRTELTAELERPLGWLRQHFPTRSVPWIAYPYGLSSSLVREVAESLGYVGGLRVEGGRFRPGREAPFATPRLNIPSGVSLDGFVLRLAGLRP